MGKKEELLKVIVENNLPGFLEYLLQQVERPDMKDKIAKLLPKIEALYKKGDGSNIEIMAKLYEKLDDKTKAFAMYQQAEKLGSMAAASRLASVYEMGELGQAINFEDAAACYLKASNDAFEFERKFTQANAEPVYIRIFRESAIASAKKAIELAPNLISKIRIPIPNEIKGENILRYIADASFVDTSDVLGKKIISKHPSFLSLVDKWCSDYQNIETFVQLEQKTGNRIRHRILEGVYAGNNELALYIKNRLVSNWEKNKNPKAQALLKEFYAAEFKFADAVGYVDKEKLRLKAQLTEEKSAVSIHSKIRLPEGKEITATHTSTASLSWREQLFNFFDRKGAQSLKKVREKQQAMNDSDPENLGQAPNRYPKGGGKR